MAEPVRPIRRLGWTLAALAAAILPHARWVPSWVVGLALAVGAWRLLAERRGWGLPGRWLRSGVAVLTAAGVMLSYRSLNGLEAGTALLIAMAALKLTETRAAREHMLLVFIGWFLCLAAFLRQQDLPTVAMVLPAAWLLAAALLEVSRVGDEGPRPRPFVATGAMLAKALPLALVLFLFFPRVQGHFWGAPSSEKAVTGLNDEMSPGDLSELTLSDTVAFRVTFQGEPPAPRDRYFRGPVLSDFDGFTWRASQTRIFTPAVEFLGAPLDYRITMEPHRRRWLFALDMVGRWPADMAAQSWDYQLLTRFPVNAVIAYDARSYLRFRAGLDITTAMRRLESRLPPGRNPRTVELARRMRAAAADDTAYIQSVLAMFREQEFFYTLEPPRLERDSVDDFLFNTRRGFCGHFASAFTTLMRAAGIPARVVTGYQGGDFNPLGGYLIVRQSNAHAWSEVWLEVKGWTRVDPTAAVAPERVERGGLDAALPEGEFVPGRFARDSEWLWRAQLAWDVVNARWNDWVVKFDLDRQQELLERLGVEDADWRDVATALAAGLAAVSALLAAWLAWEHRPPRRDAAAIAYARFERRLRRRGIERAPHEGPRVFARRIAARRPELAAFASEFTELYARVRYGPAPDPADLARLARLVRGFRP